MNYLRTALTGAMALALALPACSDKPAAKSTAVQAPIPPAASPQEGSWEAVKQYGIDRSADFRAELSARFADLERQMEPLAERAGQEWEAINADLSAKRDALAAQLEELASATSENWEQARDKTIALYLNLRDSIARAAGQPGE